MASWSHIPNIFENTICDISRYATHLCEHGDPDTSHRCFQLLRGINHNLENMYYTNVLRPSLQHVVRRERIVKAYVTTATCVVVWAVAVMNLAIPPFCRS